MRLGILGMILAGCLPVWGQAVPAQPMANRLPADAPGFRYLGAWQEIAAGRRTIHPGSQVRFCLRGGARLALQPGQPEGIMVAIRWEGADVWRGRLGSGVPSIDGGEQGAEFSVVYLAARQPRFDPALPDAEVAELEFHGLVLDEGGQLGDLPDQPGHFRMDFIGDSITVGDSILGRSAVWDRDFDASLTYSFKLAEMLAADYRIWAFGGARGGQIISQLPALQAETRGAHPRLTFINVGANNRSTNPTHYRAMMSQLMDQVFEAHPQTRIVLLNFFRMTPNRLPILRELAKTYPPGAVRCFDARAYLVGYSDGGVHPDAESHGRLACALAAFVRGEFPEAEGPASVVARGKADE